MPIGLTSLNVKESVEMLESRIPGGRKLTTLVLSLACLSAVAFFLNYLYYLLHPITVYILSFISWRSIVTASRCDATHRCLDVFYHLWTAAVCY